MHLASGLRGGKIRTVIGRPNYLKTKNSHIDIPPQSCEAVVSVARIENSPIDKYLAVKEAEDSLLHSRLCAAGLEVSKDADQSEIPFGIDTF